MAKQAALAFVKRTLERCQKFEDSGKSCFSEASFRDMFLSSSSRHHDAQLVDRTAVIESSKQYTNTSGCSLEVRVSGTSFEALQLNFLGAGYVSIMPINLLTIFLPRSLIVSPSFFIGMLQILSPL